ncbi:MAG: serine hydrolase domain-containing protein [Pseudomonadota bacterium]
MPLRFLLTLTSAIGLVTISAATPAFAQALPATEMAAEAQAYPNLQALADRYVEEGKVANMVIGVAAGDAAPAWMSAGTLGIARPAAADERSIYRIYSMTKPVIGLVTTMLIEEGLIGLDQPLAEILPAFRAMRVINDPRGGLDDTRAAETPITIRHLVTHTSGLTYDFNGGTVGRAYRTAGIVPGVRRLGILPGTGPQPTSLVELAERVAAQPLVAEPGTTWTYSVGLDIMGAVIEQVTGQPLDAVLQSRVFAPLGMGDIGFVVDAADNRRLTTNYMIAGKVPLPFPLPVEDGALVPIDAPPNSEYGSPGPIASGGGGLVSTADDYLTFLRAIADRGVVDGRQLLPAAAIDMMTSNLLPNGVDFDQPPAYGGTGTPQGFGAGGRVIINDDGNAPMGSYGWGGAAGTVANVIPGERLSLVMMTQYLPANAYPVRLELEAAARADMPGRVTTAAAGLRAVNAP